MKTLILYYSYTGHAKRIAERIAEKEHATLSEIKSVRRPVKLTAYTLGCFAALRGKAWPIQPLDTDMAAYDRLILLSPVWAGNPPPFVNSVLAQLPKGKTVAVKMVSASGESSCKKNIEAKITARGSTLESYEDIKG